VNTAVQEKNGVVPFNQADFYKTGHPGMYPKGMTQLIASFTPRTDKYLPVLKQLWDHKVVWYGLQGFIQEFLIDMFNDDFFSAKSKEDAVRKYRRRMNTALGQGVVPTTKIEALYDLGYLPLEIRSLPEGCRVNIKVPPVIFLATDDDFAWLVTYIETLFSCESWKAPTVATLAFEFRKLLTYFAKLTGAPEEFIDWQGHDFSMRGMSGLADARKCGGGHLLSFTGTDTIPAIDYLEDFYGANADTELIGGSIPATEHSVMTLRILLVMKRLQTGQAERMFDAETIAKLGEEQVKFHIERLRGELAALGQVIDQGGNAHEMRARAARARDLRKLAEEEVIRELITVDFPSGMISIVADSFDYWNTITVVAPKLKEAILARKPNELGMCKVVFRPDSGDPVKILTGYTDDELVLWASTSEPFADTDGRYTVKATGEKITEAERKGSVECLWDTFGGTRTSKGFKMLDSHVGLIYGDSISLVRARDIMLRLVAKGFASNNVVFGIGSFTYNMLSRDSLGWAMKANYAVVKDEFGIDAIEIYKDPATDDGTKKSAKGLLRAEKIGNDYVLHDQQTVEEFNSGEYVAVFRNSKFLKTFELQDMRTRLRESWVCPDPETDPIDWAEAA
jgi:nicotinamide phosphoribosyltransferase